MKNTTRPASSNASAVQPRIATSRDFITAELSIAARGGALAGRSLSSGGTGRRAAWLLDWYWSSAAAGDGGGRPGGVAISGRRPSLRSPDASLRLGAAALPWKSHLL